MIKATTCLILLALLATAHGAVYKWTQASLNGERRLHTGAAGYARIGNTVHIIGNRGVYHLDLDTLTMTRDEGAEKAYETAELPFLPKNSKGKVIKDRWRNPQPWFRNGISATAIDSDNILLLGGERNNRNSRGRALWRYTVSTQSWTRLTDAPISVAYHSAVFNGGSLYVYGGLVTNTTLLTTKITKSNGKVYYRYKTRVTEYISDALLKYDVAADTWSYASYTGSSPPALAGHSAVVVNGNMYVYGGRTPTRNRTCEECGSDADDLLGKGKCNNVPKKNGNKVSRRRQLKIAPESKGHYSLNLGSLVWSTQAALPADQSTLGRWQHAAEAQGTDIYVYGGHRQGKRMRDVYVYSTLSNTWTERTVAHSRYARGRIFRRSVGMAVVNATVYIIGGFGYNRNKDPVYYQDEQVTGISNWINVGGTRYATLDDINFDQRRTACDTILRSMPSGWSLAPTGDATRMVALMGDRSFGSLCLATSNGGSSFSFVSTRRYSSKRDCTGLEVTVSSGSYGIKRCSRHARILITQPGQVGDVDRARKAAITNFLVFEGRRFATIENDAIGERRMRCQNKPLALPGNWTVAADDATTRAAIMGAALRFGTECVVLANGNAYSTSTAEPCGGATASTATNMLDSGAGLYYVKDCKAKVLLSAPAQAGDQNTWNVAPTITSFITKGRTAYGVIDGAGPAAHSRRSCSENVAMKIPTGWTLAQDTATTRAALNKARFGGANCFVLANGATTKRNGKVCSSSRASGQLLQQGSFYTGRHCGQRVLVTRAASLSGYCRSWGDPHFTSFDGVKYNYYGVGDHVLFKTLNADFEVNVRHFQIRRASANEAIAVKFGSHKLIFMGHVEPLPTLTIDGNAVSISLDNKEKGSYTGVAGLRIDQVGATVPTMDILSNKANKAARNKRMTLTLSFSDPYPGITIELRLRASGIAAFRVMDIGLSVRGTTGFGDLITRGLCGTLDGDVSNDLLSPSNVTFVKSQGQAYGETWAVSGANSLFNTAANVDPNFTPQTTPTFATPQEEEAARQACAALIEDEDAFNACLFDIAQTGDVDMAVPAEEAEEAEEEEALGKPTPVYVTINDTVVYGGRTYAVLDGTEPSSIEAGCQTDCIVIPQGWSLVDPTAGNKASLGAHTWGTNCLAFADGTGYTPTDASSCGTELIQFSAESNGTDQCLTVRTCNTRIYLVADQDPDIGTNTLLNGGFDTVDTANNLAASWTAHGDGYSLDSTVHYQAPGTGVTKYSLYVDANNQNREYGAVQRVTLNQNTAEAFSVCGWSKAEGIDASSKTASEDYSVFVDVFYKDTSAGALYGVAGVFSDGTHGWQKRCANVLPNSTVDYINVYALVRNVKGKAWFDDFVLGPPTDDAANLLAFANLDDKLGWLPYEDGFTWDPKYDVTERGNDGRSISVKRTKLDSKNILKNYGGAYQVVLTPSWRYAPFDLADPDVVPALYVGGYSRADAVSGSEDANYALYVDITYTSGNHLYGQVATFPTGTHGWVYRDVLIPLNETMSSFQVVLLFRNHTGEVWFDEPSAVLTTTARSNLPAITHGDPHIVTLDGLFYDLQQIGEFVLMQDDMLEVQVRHAKAGNAAVTSAVALQYDGNSTLEVERSAGYTEPTLRFNGQLLAAAASGSFELPDQSGTVTVKGSLSAGQSSVMSYVVTYPASNHIVDVQVRVSAFNVQYLRAVLTLPDTSVGNTVGLLGNYNGNPNDDLISEDGVQYNPANVTHTQLYDEFAESWRVEDEDSLFHFPTGATNDDVTDLTFYQPVSLADLTPEQRAAAEAACASLSNSKAVYTACMYDVVQTGDTSMSEGMDTIQGLAGTVEEPLFVPQSVQAAVDPTNKDEPIWWTVLRIVAFVILGATILVFGAMGVRKQYSKVKLEEQKEEERRWAAANSASWKDDSHYPEEKLEEQRSSSKKTIDLEVLSVPKVDTTKISKPRAPPRRHRGMNSVAPV